VYYPGPTLIHPKPQLRCLAGRFSLGPNSRNPSIHVGSACNRDAPGSSRFGRAAAAHDTGSDAPATSPRPQPRGCHSAPSSASKATAGVRLLRPQPRPRRRRRRPSPAELPRMPKSGHDGKGVAQFRLNHCLASLGCWLCRVVIDLTFSASTDSR
jgi:hypothetical protein